MRIRNVFRKYFTSSSGFTNIAVLVGLTLLLLPAAKLALNTPSPSKIAESPDPHANLIQVTNYSIPSPQSTDKISGTVTIKNISETDVIVDSSMCSVVNGVVNPCGANAAPTILNKGQEKKLDDVAISFFDMYKSNDGRFYYAMVVEVALASEGESKLTKVYTSPSSVVERTDHSSYPWLIATPNVTCNPDNSLKLSFILNTDGPAHINIGGSSMSEAFVYDTSIINTNTQVEYPNSYSNQYKPNVLKLNTDYYLILNSQTPGDSNPKAKVDFRTPATCANPPADGTAPGDGGVIPKPPGTTLSPVPILSPCPEACHAASAHTEGTACDPPTNKTWQRSPAYDAYCAANPGFGGNTCWVCKTLTDILKGSGVCSGSKGGLNSNNPSPITPRCGGEGFDMAKARSSNGKYYCGKTYTDVYTCNNGTDEIKYDWPDNSSQNPCNGAVWCPGSVPTVGPGTPIPTVNPGGYCPASTNTCEAAPCESSGKKRSDKDPNIANIADQACKGINPFTGKKYGDYCCAKSDAKVGTTPGATGTPNSGGTGTENERCTSSDSICAPQFKCVPIGGGQKKCVYKNPSEPGAYCSTANNLHCEAGPNCNTGTKTGVGRGDNDACDRAGLGICCSTKPTPTPAKLGHGQTCSVGGMPCEDWLECKTVSGAIGMCVSRPGVTPPAPTINPGGYCTDENKKDLGCACTGTGSSGCGILSPYACMQPAPGQSKSACCPNGQRACDDGTCAGYPNFTCSSNSNSGNPAPATPTPLPNCPKYPPGGTNICSENPCQPGKHYDGAGSDDACRGTNPDTGLPYGKYCCKL